MLRRPFVATSLVAAALSFGLVACTDAARDASQMAEVSEQASALNQPPLAQQEANTAAAMASAQAATGTTVRSAMASIAAGRKRTLSGSFVQATADMPTVNGTTSSVMVAHAGSVLSAADVAAPSKGLLAGLTYLNIPTDGTFGPAVAPGYYDAVYFPAAGTQAARVELRDIYGRTARVLPAVVTGVAAPTGASKLKIDIHIRPGEIEISIEWERDRGAVSAIIAANGPTSGQAPDPRGYGNAVYY